MLIALCIMLALTLGTFLFLQTERFGALPGGERLERVKASPNYRNGSFQNLEVTPMLTEGYSYGKVLYKFLFRGKPKEPKQPLPSAKTDLRALSPTDNVLIWMGHSSYFLQVDGLKLLIDPVLSGNAAPFTTTTKAYPGTDIYTPADFPELDYLLLSHDHWDHLDYRTLKTLRPKVKAVVTGLGTGAHLERWGYDSAIIREGDWYDQVQLRQDVSLHLTPARHFSGRGFKRAQALWTSFVLTTPSFNLFLGGDSGYGEHFSEIGERFGPFDLAVLENGQYDPAWAYLHMMPGEHLKAAADLRARTVLPVHSAKFTLANHDWDTPLATISAAGKTSNIRVVTPMIGAELRLDDAEQKFTEWWDD